MTRKYCDRCEKEIFGSFESAKRQDAFIVPELVEYKTDAVVSITVACQKQPDLCVPCWAYLVDEAVELIIGRKN